MLALELIGIVAFAISGGLAAVKQRFDLVGVVALSVVTAVGGGAIRDVLLGDQPVVALTERWYLLAPIITGVVVMGFHRHIEQYFRRPVMVFDAAGLGLFCVTGAMKAIEFDIAVAGVIGLGTLTATGGGVVRDLLCSERPVMFRADSVLYSIPAALGASAVVIADSVDADTQVVGGAIAAGVFVFRLLALRFRWHAPRPADR